MKFEMREHDINDQYAIYQLVIDDKVVSEMQASKEDGITIEEMANKTIEMYDEKIKNLRPDFIKVRAKLSVLEHVKKDCMALLEKKKKQKEENEGDGE